MTQTSSSSREDNSLKTLRLTPEEMRSRVSDRKVPSEATGGLRTIKDTRAFFPGLSDPREDAPETVTPKAFLVNLGTAWRPLP